VNDMTLCGPAITRVLSPTSQRIEELIVAGLTNPEIRDALGVSRNQVIGVRRRMYMREKPAGEPPMQQQIVEAVEEPAVEPIKTVTLPAKVDPSLFVCDEIEIDEVEFEEPPVEAPGVSVAELTSGMCRYPIAYTDQHYFCGNPRRDVKSSYCDEHHSLIWVKPIRAVKKKSSDAPRRR